MNQPQRTNVQSSRRVRADVRQALLKSSCAHLYPGIPPGEWQPASVMVDLVQGLGTGHRGSEDSRDRVLDGDHFEFRGRPSAGTQDDERRLRLEERRERRDGDANG